MIQLPLFGFVVLLCVAVAVGWMLRDAGFGLNVKSTIPGSNTIVELRETKRVNSRRWRAEVHYDAWGCPYVAHPDQSLLENGRTSDYWLYGTEWRHVSGPEVTFGYRPVSGAFSPGADRYLNKRQ